MEPDGREMIIGGETVSAKDDYLKTITNLFFKINAAADNRNVNELSWILDFYVEMLISAILNPDARDRMRTAKADIFQIELLKTPDKGSSANSQQKANIASCLVVVGECRSYFDKYFGFETKLAVMI